MIITCRYNCNPAQLHSTRVSTRGTCAPFRLKGLKPGPDSLLRWKDNTGSLEEGARQEALTGRRDLEQGAQGPESSGFKRPPGPWGPAVAPGTPRLMRNGGDEKVAHPAWPVSALTGRARAALTGLAWASPCSSGLALGAATRQTLAATLANPAPSPPLPRRVERRPARRSAAQQLTPYPWWFQASEGLLIIGGVSTAPQV